MDGIITKNTTEEKTKTQHTMNDDVIQQIMLGQAATRVAVPRKGVIILTITTRKENLFIIMMMEEVVKVKNGEIASNGMIHTMVQNQ